uniref:EPS8 signaling adaptor L1b n=1 Tax=Hippocampus comes TaxID=109280 RepID=A0A3Q2YMM8_HIPCM
ELRFWKQRILEHKRWGGPALAASVSSPALTGAAVSLLQENLNVEERQLWTSLGPNWTHARSVLLGGLRGPIAPYTPVFLDGWKPDAFRADGRVWEDPVESQHKHEALRLKQEVHNDSRKRSLPACAMVRDHYIGLDVTSACSLPPERDTGGPPEFEKVYSCSYDFIARNNTELSVQQGETLEVLESSKRWWKCRNRFNQVGFVPFNILEPVTHVDSPVANPPSSAPAPTRQDFHPSRTQPRWRSNFCRSGWRDKPDSCASFPVMLVNDELLQRLTNGKAINSKPLIIPLTCSGAVWTVTCLGVLTGAQLFSLSKDELREVIPDEGARVYSQMAVQRALLEDARRATELEAVMEKQKMKVDLKLESSTL